MEKIIDQASKILADTSEIILDRFKNPYITAFSISWIIFNWKAILFFIFSKGNVEYKIKQITAHHSDLSHTFFYPFGVSIVFLFCIPYLNQANEWFLKLSVKKRAEFKKNQFVDKIHREKEIAIAIDEQQTAIKNARESTDINKYIDELKGTVEDTKRLLSEERLKNSEENKAAQDQQYSLIQQISELRNTYNNQISFLHKELNDKQASYNKLLNENDNSKLKIDNSTSKINELNYRLEKLQQLQIDSQNAIDIQKEIRFYSSESSNAYLFTFLNGERILEINTNSPYPKYIDYDRKTTIPLDYVSKRLKTKEFNIISTPIENFDLDHILNEIYNNDKEKNSNNDSEAS